jgi:hypothetical protein
MFRTPEFQLTIMLLSSPVALLVALRGMTDKVITQRTLPLTNQPFCRIVLT